MQRTQIDLEGASYFVRHFGMALVLLGAGLWMMIWGWNGGYEPTNQDLMYSGIILFGVGIIVTIVSARNTIKNPLRSDRQKYTLKTESHPAGIFVFIIVLTIYFMLGGRYNGSSWSWPLLLIGGATLLLLRRKVR